MLLLLLGQLPQTGDHSLRPLQLVQLDERLDEVGRDRERARLVHSLPLVLSQTVPRLSAARVGSWPSRAAIPRARNASLTCQPDP